MAAVGIPEDQIVAAITNADTGLPISPKTLRRHYRKELDEGHIQANAKVAAGLFKNATTVTERHPGGLPIAQIFWLKCRMRWQQNPERNPLPPAPTDPETGVDPKETARRLAFVLAKGAHEGKSTASAPAPAKRRKVPA